MNQATLRDKIEYLCEFKPYDEAAELILEAIHDYISQDIIGEDEPEDIHSGINPSLREFEVVETETRKRNKIRASQRERLEKDLE